MESYYMPGIDLGETRAQLYNTLSSRFSPSVVTVVVYLPRTLGL